MDKDVLISVQGVSKKFCRNLKRSMVYGIQDLSKSFLGIRPNTSQLRKDEFWALKDVSFKLRTGDALGILGFNGAGKTTLLRLITGLFPPDSGEISIRGRVGALIGLGAGFHNHLTGRQNIFLNGTILGMRSADIKRKLDDIIDFARIGEFIDAPVATYSTGMRARLGFAIAIHVDPEILIVDEVLSVGDMSFVSKGLRHMAEMRDRAQGIIFVSHSAPSIQAVCNRCLIMNQGRLIADEPVETALVKYEEMSRTIRADEADGKKEKVGTRWSSGETRIEKLTLIGASGEETKEVSLRGGMKVRAVFKIFNNMRKLQIVLGVINERLDTTLIYLRSELIAQVSSGDYSVECEIDSHHLNTGVYFLRMGLVDAQTGAQVEKVFSDSSFIVKSDGRTTESGAVFVDNPRWQVKQAASSN